MRQGGGRYAEKDHQSVGREVGLRGEVQGEAWEVPGITAAGGYGDVYLPRPA